MQFFRGRAVGEQEEKQVNRNDGNVRAEREYSKQSAAGRAQGRHGLDHDRVEFALQRVDEMPDGGVGELALDQRHPLRVMAAEIVAAAGPERRGVINEIEHLVNERWHGDDDDRRPEQQKNAEQQDHGGGAVQAESALQHGDDGAQDQCQHPRDGERPDHAGKIPEETGQHQDAQDDRGHGGASGEHGQGGAGHASLGVAEQWRGFERHGQQRTEVPKGGQSKGAARPLTASGMARWCARCDAATASVPWRAEARWPRACSRGT